LAHATEFQIGNCFGMLLRLIPFSAECDRDRDRLLGLDVYMHTPAVIARAVDTASVIVSGVELREFVAGAYPVENLVLCPARRRKQNQQPEQDRFSHKRPSRYRSEERRVGKECRSRWSPCK